MRSWVEQWCIEWEQITAQLRKYKHLDHIRLTSSVGTRYDLREYMELIYNRDMREVDVSINELCRLIGMKRSSFTKTCRGGRNWNEKEKAIIADYFGMTDEDIERYLE